MPDQKDNTRLLSVDGKSHLFAENSAVLHRLESNTLNGRGYSTWIIIQLTWKR